MNPKILRPLSILIPFATLALLAACDTFEPEPFDARALQYRERQDADENQTPDMRPLPDDLQSPFLPERRPTAEGTQLVMPTTVPTTLPAELRATFNQPATRLTLQQVIHLSVLNSLDVRVAGYQPAVDAARVLEAQGNFDLTFYSKFQFQNQDVVSPSASLPTLNPLTSTIGFRDGSLETGFKQNLPDGGQAQLSYTWNGSAPLTPPGVTAAELGFSPFYTSELALQLTQPLLNNFGPEFNQARILLARDTQKISLMDARLALEKNVADIEEAYWQLVLAERTVNIQEALLERTWDTASLLFRRRGQDSSNVEISQANSRFAARYAQLARAQAQVDKYSDKIKSLMNDPDFPTSGAILILPADDPVQEPIRFDLADEIRTALGNRAELSEQQTRINTADLTRRAAKTNLLPTLNLTLSAGVEGIGANLGQALASQDDFSFFNYGVGVDLEVPIGNRSAEAIYQRALLQRQQAIDQYRNLIEKITDEVKDAQRDVMVSWELVRNRESRFAAAEALRLLEQREPAVTLSPEFVLTKLSLQSDLADAQRAEIEAAVNYNIAISALERAKGTILRYNNVEMSETPLPYGAHPRR